MKIIERNKRFAGNLVNEKGNISRQGVVHLFSDLEVLPLNLATEALRIDSINCLFSKLRKYRKEVPYWLNQENWKPTFIPFTKARKRIKIVFSQLCQTKGLFIRIIGKISALTVLQYINKINNRPIRQVKYALI